MRAPLQVRLPFRSVREQEQKPGIKIQFSVRSKLAGIWDSGEGFFAAFHHLVPLLALVVITGHAKKGESTVNARQTRPG
jgi:hypothetical protein